MDNEAHRFDSGEGWPWDYRNVGHYLSASAPIKLPNNPFQEPTAHNNEHLLLTRTGEFWLTCACLGSKLWLGPGLLCLTSALSRQAAS